MHDFLRQQHSLDVASQGPARRIDRHDLDLARSKRLGNAQSGRQRHVALGRGAAHENRDLQTVGGWWLVAGGWWLVVCDWWLVVGGWWLVVGGWWLVAGGIRICRRSAPAILLHQPPVPSHQPPVVSPAPSDNSACPIA